MKKIEIEISDNGDVSVLNNSGMEVFLEQNSSGYSVTIPKTGSWESINSYEDAFRALGPRFYLDRMAEIRRDLNHFDDVRRSNREVSFESCIDSHKYIKRKLIAQALGARPFVVGEKNHRISIRASLADVTFSFDTEKQMERFEKICQKEGLL